MLLKLCVRVKKKKNWNGNCFYFISFDYETTRHTIPRDTHSHARDAFNVPKSTDAASQLLMDAECWRLWDVCANSVGIVVFLFVIQVGCLDWSAKLCSLILSQLTHRYNGTDSSPQERASHRSEASSQRAKERILIAKHVDFSMCLLSTFCLFSQMPYSTRPEYAMIRMGAYTAPCYFHVVYFALSLFFSLWSIVISTLFGFRFPCAFSLRQLLNVVIMSHMSRIQRTALNDFLFKTRFFLWISPAAKALEYLKFQSSGTQKIQKSLI